MFAHTLFGLLRLPLLSFTEAFAMANHTLRAYGSADTGAKRNPIHPVLDSAEPPELPGTKPAPLPNIAGVDLSLGLSRSIPGELLSCILYLLGYAEVGRLLTHSEHCRVGGCAVAGTDR